MQPSPRYGCVYETRTFPGKSPLKLAASSNLLNPHFPELFPLVVVIKMRPKHTKKKKKQKSCCSSRSISPYSVAVGVTVSSLVLLAIYLAIATQAERAKNIEYEEKLLSKDSEISNLKKEVEKRQDIIDQLNIELKIQRLQSTEDRQAYLRKLDQLTEFNIQCNNNLRTCQHDLKNPPRDWATAAAACGACATIGAFVPGGSAAVNLAIKGIWP